MFNGDIFSPRVSRVCDRPGSDGIDSDMDEFLSRSDSFVLAGGCLLEQAVFPPPSVASPSSPTLPAAAPAQACLPAESHIYSTR